MQQVFTVISIVFVVVLTNGNGLSVACVFFIIVILDMLLINMRLGKHISDYIFILQNDEQQVVLNTVTLYYRTTVFLLSCICVYN
jgi:hypothetical protein